MYPTSKKHERGVAAVELAVLLPFLCFLLILTMDYARLFYFGVTVQNCARNGAYYASNYPNNSYIYNDIYGYRTLEEAITADALHLNPGAPIYSYQVRYDTSENGSFAATTKPTGNCFVKVTVIWQFRSLTNFPGFPASVDVTRSSIMRVAPDMPRFDGDD